MSRFTHRLVTVISSVFAPASGRGDLHAERRFPERAERSAVDRDLGDVLHVA